MLVYRSAERTESPRRLLEAVAASCDLCNVRAQSYDDWVELLIDAGEIESALADAEAPLRDDITPIAAAFRRLVRLLAHVVVRSWQGGNEGVAALSPVIEHAVRESEALPLPDVVRVRVPEGYAYYGLYPETYMASARQFATALVPRSVVVVGIRSIGTSLSAVVAATLAELGIRVTSVSVRPRGHPFARTCDVGERLAGLVRASEDALFVIVDEGPGLSGSSFASVAEMLASHGVPDERIVFFPSWNPGPRPFAHSAAAERWRRHRTFTGDFNALWVRSGRLTDGLTGSLLDISAGAWRDELYPAGAPRPAAQPQHEQRKFLWTRGDRDADVLFLKFVGLGRYGKRRLQRARRLSEDGWGPPPVELRHGFLVRPWLPGTPFDAGGVAPELLETIARYIAYLDERHRTPTDVPAAQLLEMMRTNVREALGEEWLASLAPAQELLEIVNRAPTSACDGRLQPHEWLACGGSIVKTDALSHHDDHFLPGCQNVAWDLAGAVVELDLDAGAERFLLDAYVGASGDNDVRQRMPFFRIAYLAFRIGYASIAAAALQSGADADGMRALAARYSQRLASVLHSEAAMSA